MVTLLPLNLSTALRRRNVTIAPAWPPTETTDVVGLDAPFKELVSFAEFPNLTGLPGSQLFRAFLAFDSSGLNENEITGVKLKVGVTGAPGCEAQLNPDGSPGYDFFECMPTGFPPFAIKLYSWAYSGVFGGAGEWSNVGSFLVEVTTEGALEITIPTSAINVGGFTGFAVLFSDEASGPPAPTITDPRPYNFIGQSYILSNEGISFDFNAPGSGLEVTQSDEPPPPPPPPPPLPTGIEFSTGETPDTELFTCEDETEFETEFFDTDFQTEDVCLEFETKEEL